MTYATPNISEASDILKHANTITNGYFGMMFAVATCIIIFIILHNRGYRNSDAASVSLGLGFVLCSMAWAMGVVSVAAPMVMLVLTGIAIFVSMMTVD